MSSMGKIKGVVELHFFENEVDEKEKTVLAALIGPTILSKDMEMKTEYANSGESFHRELLSHSFFYIVRVKQEML